MAQSGDRPVDEADYTQTVDDHVGVQVPWAEVPWAEAAIPWRNATFLPWKRRWGSVSGG